MRKEAQTLALGVCSHPPAQKQGPWAPCLLLGLGRACRSACPALPDRAAGRAQGAPAIVLGLPGFGDIQQCGVLLCARAAGDQGAGAKRGKDAASWLKLLPESPGCAPGHGGPVALPVWGCAPAPPSWRRCSHGCKLPAHDGQRCPWGSPPWEQGCQPPSHRLGSPVPPHCGAGVPQSKGDLNAAWGSAR